MQNSFTIITGGYIGEPVAFAQAFVRVQADDHVVAYRLERRVAASRGITGADLLADMRRMREGA